MSGKQGFGPGDEKKRPGGGAKRKEHPSEEDARSDASQAGKKSAQQPRGHQSKKTKCQICMRSEKPVSSLPTS